MNNSKIPKNKPKKSKNKHKVFTFFNSDKNVSLSTKLGDNAKKDTVKALKNTSSKLSKKLVKKPVKEPLKEPMEELVKEPVKEAAENLAIEKQVKETIETIEVIEAIDAIGKSVENEETEKEVVMPIYFDKLPDASKEECIRCCRKRVPGSNLCQFHIDRLKRKAEEEKKAKLKKERARKMKISL